MPPVRQDSLDEKKTEHDRVVGQMGEGEGFDLQKPLTSGVSLSFSRGQHLLSPDEYFAYRTPSCNTEFRRNNARSVDRVSFAIRPLVFLPVPLISGFLWEAFATGSSWDDSRFAFRSIAPRAGKRGCSPSYKRGQSFETADSITACANNNQNSLGPLYFSFQEKNKNSKFRI